jgi:hypothetical protein
VARGLSWANELHNPRSNADHGARRAGRYLDPPKVAQAGTGLLAGTALKALSVNQIGHFRGSNLRGMICSVACHRRCGDKNNVGNCQQPYSTEIFQAIGTSP